MHHGPAAQSTTGPWDSLIQIGCGRSKSGSAAQNDHVWQSFPWQVALHSDEA
jgi:hypothetical protein